MEFAGELPPPDEESFRRIASLVYRHAGIRLAPGRDYFVASRLGPLYRALRCSAWRDLCEHLETGEGDDLRQELIHAVVTGETQFFRDGLPFHALTRRLLPEVRARGVDRPFLRIWSAGCSTGQEPYSIAFTLWDAFEEGEADFEVWATDICRRSLAYADKGLYGPLELLRGLPPEARQRFFRELPGGFAQVRTEVRRKIRYEALNLLTEAPGRSRLFHAVFCRNVAIYFDREGKRRLYESLGAAVLPGGYLVLGATETLMPGLPGFQTEYFGKCLLFRKAVSKGDLASTPDVGEPGQVPKHGCWRHAVDVD